MFFFFCCASPRSFTVVVLMRDESGYMMLLLLLPFHQQRKPTNTHSKRRNDTAGFPCDSQRPAFISIFTSLCRKTEARFVRGLFVPPVLIAPAVDAFFFQLSIGPDLNKEISSDSGPCSTPASVIGLKDQYPVRKPLSLFRSVCCVLRIDPDRQSVPWSPH